MGVLNDPKVEGEVLVVDWIGLGKDEPPNCGKANENPELAGGLFCEKIPLAKALFVVAGVAWEAPGPVLENKFSKIQLSGGVRLRSSMSKM